MCVLHLAAAGVVWLASVIVGSPMLFVQQLEVSDRRRATESLQSARSHGLVLLDIRPPVDSISSLRECASLLVL